jgi:hypothetical protein
MCLLSKRFTPLLVLVLLWRDNIFKILLTVQNEQNTHAHISYHGWGNPNTTQL